MGVPARTRLTDSHARAQAVILAKFAKVGDYHIENLFLDEIFSHRLNYLVTVQTNFLFYFLRP